MLQKNKLLLLLIFLILIGVTLRFYNLAWGEPYFFHPDERNIAYAVTKLEFPNQMNPQFFAYGSLPIYAIYFTGLVINFINQFPAPSPYPLNPTFEQAIIISRFYSALFSALLIPLLFVIARSIATKQSHEIATLSFAKLRIARNDSIGLFAAFLATTSIGFTQFAHFGTFEMWLTFFSVLLFWLCLKIYTSEVAERTPQRWIVLAGFVFGVLVATKVSSLALLPLPILAIIIHQLKRKHHAVIPANAGIQKDEVKKNSGSRIKSGMTIVKYTLIFILTAALVYTLTNPYVFLDTQSFKSSMEYESSLALGNLQVFYTGEFFNTIPVLYQLQHVYPFLLNPLVLLLFIPSLFYIVFKTIKTKSFPLLLLTSFFLILLVSQAFLFVKWTRYMVPTLPFVYLIIAIAISQISKSETRNPKQIQNTNLQNSKRFEHLIFGHLDLSCTERANVFRYSILDIRILKIFIITIFININILFSLSYFITAFIEPDTRIAAKNFTKQAIPADAPVLSEVYDLGIIAFNDSLHKIDLFNFYDLESHPNFNQELQIKLANAEYILLPSQRLLKIRLQNKKQFPRGHEFYTSLTTDALGYRQIYQSPCSIFCRITYLGDPVFRYEETANVFERPTVFIFSKNKN